MLSLHISGHDVTPTAPWLRAENLAAGYGDVLVIHGVCIEVRQGEVVTIIGPNGAGKSTVLKALAGVIPVRDGKVSVGEDTISGRRADQIARLGVGYVPQIRDVFTKLTVAENLELGGCTRKAGDTNGHMEAVFDIFPGLAQMRTRRAGQLSGGERKMLAIGRVLMMEPSVMLLDEPTANLSPIVAKSLLHEHVTSLARTGVAMLIVEQRAMEALAVSDRAYLMVGGKVVLTDESSSLLRRDDIGELFLGR
jgi:ABC-type branched-subunit amino acid transport system ATPase component